MVANFKSFGITNLNTTLIVHATLNIYVLVPLHGTKSRHTSSTRWHLKFISTFIVSVYNTDFILKFGIGAYLINRHSYKDIWHSYRVTNIIRSRYKLGYSFPNCPRYGFCYLSKIISVSSNATQTGQKLVTYSCSKNDIIDIMPVIEKQSIASVTLIS